MTPIRLEAGVKNISKNAKKLIRNGWKKEEAYEYAYRFARTQSSRVIKNIHTNRHEQRAR